MSLAKYKMDKIIEGVLDKDYSREPSLVFSLNFLWERFHEEVDEIDKLYDITKDEIPLMQKFITLENCIGNAIEHNHKRIGYPIRVKEFEDVKRELADLSNFIDFVFDKILLLESVVKNYEG